MQEKLTKQDFIEKANTLVEDLGECEMECRDCILYYGAYQKVMNMMRASGADLDAAAYSIAKQWLKEVR